MSEKIIGYILIGVGVLTISFSGLSVYQVFTKKTLPVALFSFKGISIDMSKMLSASLPAELRNSGVTLPPAQTEIIPAEMVNLPTNFLFHTILMGFLSSVGLKIAQVGTYMVRTIEVTVKERNNGQQETKQV